MPKYEIKKIVDEQCHCTWECFQRMNIVHSPSLYPKVLSNLIKKKLSKKYVSNNNILITRERHRIKLNECLKEIDKFLKKDQNKHLELAAEDLRMATRHLGGIVGKVDVEEILGSIFKDFCIGK